MFFQLGSLAYASAYLGLIELLFFYADYSLYLFPLFLIYPIFATVRLSHRWPYIFAPTVLSISSLALFYLIDSHLSRQIFSVISSLVFYFIMLGFYRLRSYNRDQTARGLVAAGCISALFLFFTSFYGFYLNFNIPIWWLMTSWAVVAVFLSYQYFSLIERKRKSLVVLYSLILAMVMAEIAWVINFWPFGYLTTGVIALIFYYVLWDMVQSYFLNLLSKKRVVANVVFLCLMVAMVLSSSRWLPAV
jgi:hypothetical protein